MGEYGGAICPSPRTKTNRISFDTHGLAYILHLSATHNHLHWQKNANQNCNNASNGVHPRHTNDRSNMNSDRQINHSHLVDMYNFLSSISERVMWNLEILHSFFVHFSLIHIPSFRPHFFRAPVHTVLFCILQPILVSSQIIPSLHQRIDCVPL